MKKTIISLAVLAVLLAGGLWFLQRKVNERLATALPEASRSTGLPMKAGSLGVNLLNGSGEIRDFSIASPAGFPDLPLFELAEGRVSVRYLPLLSGKVLLGDVRVKEAQLTIIRLADGQVNIRRKKPVPVPGTPKRDVPAAEEKGKTLPSVGVGQLDANLVLTYRDYAVTDGGKPFEAVFRLDLTAANLATYGTAADEADWGPLEAKGVVESNGKSAPVVFKGRLAPLTDLTKPSFRLNGQFEKLEAELIRPLLGNSGVTGEAERLEMDLFALNGRFDEAQSRLTLVLKNVKYGNSSLPELTLASPVHGTVEKPKLRVEQALLGVLGQILSAPRAEGDGKKKSKNGLDIEAISKGLEGLFKK
jgi:hypothetical protein